MPRKLNINCDMGEGFGRWTLGDDAGILPLVPTANIATGFHGGDPSIMRQVVGMAQELGVDVGAHVALPDLLGFGRRRIDVSPQELQDYITYQVGAMGAFARAAGAELVHVKPHGILYSMAGQDPALCRALLTAVHDYDANLIVISAGAETPPSRQSSDCGCCPRPIAILTTTPMATLSSSGASGPGIRRRWRGGPCASPSRRRAPPRRHRAELDMRTICVHGDAPNSVEVATTFASGWPRRASR